MENPRTQRVRGSKNAKILPTYVLEPENTKIAKRKPKQKEKQENQEKRPLRHQKACDLVILGKKKTIKSIFRATLAQKNSLPRHFGAPSPPASSF